LIIFIIRSVPMFPEPMIAALTRAIAVPSIKPCGAHTNAVQRHFKDIAFYCRFKRYKAAREDHVPGIKRDPMGAKRIGQPCNSLRWIALNRAAIAFGQRSAVLGNGDMQCRKIVCAWISPRLTKHKHTAAGIVGDSIDDPDLPVLDPAIDDLEARRDA
jgi:hypothetical protein